MTRKYLWLLLSKIFVAVSFVATLIQDNAEVDRIANLPGLTFTPNFKQYSGFLSTKTENFLHYWLIESQNNPSTDPLVLWINGASGCNSLDGLLAQIGPFRVNQDGETLFENIYSWNKAANLIFLDSPYGVGYSYRDAPMPSYMLWNDDQTAEDNADALEQFFQRFKEYQNRDFYITGQGYAGIYGPTLVNVLLKRIQQNGNPYGIKLAGLVIGNGAYNEVDRRNSILSFVILLPRTIYKHSTDALDGFPCYITASITKYLNQDYVRHALHIPDYIPPYQLCNENILDNYKSLYNDTTQFFQQLLDSNYPLRTLIYNGDLDAVCNFLHAEWFIEKFAKSNSMGMNEKNAWFYRLGTQQAPQIGGYKKRFEKDNTTIDLVIVKGAGHTAPLDHAGPMLQILTNFIRQKDYNDVSPFSLDRQPLLPQFTLTTPIGPTSQCV